MGQKPPSKRQKAMLSLAYHVLDTLVMRVQDDKGYFVAHYVATMEQCFTAYVYGARCWPSQIRQLWTLLATDCKPDHPMVNDEDRAARLALMRRIKAFSRKSGLPALTEIANSEIA